MSVQLVNILNNIKSFKSVPAENCREGRFSLVQCGTHSKFFTTLWLSGYQLVLHVMTEFQFNEKCKVYVLWYT